MRTHLVVAALLFPAVAQAQVRFEASTGFFSSDAIQSAEEPGGDSTGGVLVGAMLTGRTGGVEAGAVFDTGAQLFGGGMHHVGAVVGPALDLSATTRVTLLGEAGLGIVSGIGEGLFDKSVGGDSTAALPYAGLRAGLTHDVGELGGISLGYGVVVRRDFGRERVTTTIESCFLGCSTDTETYDVGGTYTGLFVDVAVQ